MSNSHRNINKTGLTFSISDVNFDSNSLDLVPIQLNSPVNENRNNTAIDNVVDSLLNFKSTNLNSNYNSMIDFIDCSVEIQNEDDKTNKSRHDAFVLNEQSRNFDESNNSQQLFASASDNKQTFNYSSPLYSNNDNLNINSIYETVSCYWFYCVVVNKGSAEWKPFSIKDSQRIEGKYLEIIENSETKFASIDDCVATDGGRYDVFINKRQKLSVYWEEAPMEIRRACWFYRPEDEAFYIPYTEQECNQLELQYRIVLENNKWHQPFELNINQNERCVEDRFVFHSPNTMVEYRYISGGGTTDSVMKGRIVYRGIEGFRNHLEHGESDNIDHVVFVIHGIGSICDMAGRGIVECVQIMKNISGKLLESHFPRHSGRIELLPVSWHSKFHSETSTVDRDLTKITLKSVPKLRYFTNNTLVDVLCYSSSMYCQTILTIVAAEMNRLRHLFVSRNPQYDGEISIVGHSLGAMIAFDLISLQDRDSEVDFVPVIDVAGIPKLEFEIGHLFALGSPISLLLTARGHSMLGEEFRLGNCSGFFNIFHPFDPVAYRMEPMLLSSQSIGMVIPRPVVIPHHKGRKRLHLELKDNLVRVSHDIKSRLVQTLKNTWSSLQEFATSHSGNIVTDELGGDNEIMRVLDKINGTISDRDDVESTTNEIEIVMGQLNGGKRIDYVLQEAPLESFNDYLFALGSHACYWDSEDTVLMMLKEIYITLNIYPEARPNDSLINIIKPHSRSLNIPTPLPPIIPLVSPHQTVSNSPLPPTFSSIQNKQYFIPNFNVDQSGNEQSEFNVKESLNLEPLTTLKVSEEQSQHTVDLPPPTGLITYELSNITQGNSFHTDFDRAENLSSFPNHQNENNFKSSIFSKNYSERSDLLDIQGRPPPMPFYPNKDNETYSVQPPIITNKPEKDENLPGKLAISLYPPPPIMPNSATVASTQSTVSHCYVASTKHYLQNSSNNLIQKQLLSVNLQSSLPIIPTLSKNTFYPSETTSEVDYQSNQDSFHLSNQLNIETNAPVKYVSVAMQPPSFTNYLSSPPLIEQFQSIISSNSSLSNDHPSTALSSHLQPEISSGLSGLLNLFQPSSALPETVTSKEGQHLTSYFNDNQSVVSTLPSEIITSHTTESSNVFDTNALSGSSHFYGYANTDKLIGSDSDTDRFPVNQRPCDSNKFSPSVNVNEPQQWPSGSNKFPVDQFSPSLNVNEPQQWPSGSNKFPVDQFSPYQNINESQRWPADSNPLISDSIWKSSEDSSSNLKPDNCSSGFDQSKPPVLSHPLHNNINPSSSDTKAKLKTNQDFSSNDNYSRTPSPRIFNQTPRNSPRTSIVPSVPVPMFSSRPLMPQSGKLFKKK